MKFKRLFLRYSLNFQKLKIKLYNLETDDFQKAYIVVSKRLYRVVHLRNLVIFCLVFLVIVFSMFLSSFKTLGTYYKKDEPFIGGVYSEGSMGQFLLLNPLYSVTNQNDADAADLIFSGLMKHDQGKNIVPDMASKWSLSKDEKTYTFNIKRGVKWQDGKPFTADDVMFTIQTIQNPDAKSSLYETWKGVKLAKTGDYEVKFILGAPDKSFLENTTLGIIPQHILSGVPAADMQTVDFNTAPIGTGPYKFESMDKEPGKETLVLNTNSYYYSKKPYINKVVMESFLDSREMLDEYHKRNILAIANPNQSLVTKLKNDQTTNIHTYTLPRYVAAFFNVDNKFLNDKNLRLVISKAVDRKVMIDRATNGEGLAVYSPFAYGPSGQDSQNVKTNVEEAKKVLDNAGYKLNHNKLSLKGDSLKLRIVTEETDELEKTAQVFQEELKSLGIDSEIQTADMNNLQNNYLRPRNYDILILGENSGLYGGLFSFWHSSQVQDPGLNFSKYKSPALDKFLEILRTTNNPVEKQKMLTDIDNIFKEDNPAVYLYNPFYDFIVSDKVKGIQDGKLVVPTDRLNEIENWYLKFHAVSIDG